MIALGEILEGDCLEVMAGMEENSVDSIVCDPPYALGFMGKAWDRFPTDKGPKKPFANQSKESKLGGMPYQEWCRGWAVECLRIAKPGAYLLAFGGTRTFHRLACAIEDAGWTLRDTLSWNYGSGFPKSHDVSKALDSKAGAEREVVGYRKNLCRTSDTTKSGAFNASEGGMFRPDRKVFADTAPATPEAKQWDGFGTALKPAWEPVLLFQKPLEGTYAENILKWNCGALNIDSCRIGKERVSGAETGREIVDAFTGEAVVKFKNKQGRWPANFLLSHTIFCEKVGEREAEAPDRNTWDGGASYFDGAGHQKEKSYTKGGGGKEIVDVYQCVPDCPVRMLDEQSGSAGLGRAFMGGGTHRNPQRNGVVFSNPPIGYRSPQYYDQGGASRFFYTPKASREERNAGLEAVHTLFEKREGFEEATTDDGREKPIDNPYLRGETMRSNSHPTVKPIALMRYLCRLVTPPGGTVLDCFAGSGSTGCAAVLEGFEIIGIEKEKGYAEIARARIAHFSGRKP